MTRIIVVAPEGPGNPTLPRHAGEQGTEREEQAGDPRNGGAPVPEARLRRRGRGQELMQAAGFTHGGFYTISAARTSWSGRR